jgi:transposase
MEPLTALFPPGKGGGSGVEYGFKGKGVLIHTLVDGNGSPLAISVTPANGDERVEALELIDGLSVKSGSVGRPKKSPKIVAADKGYDSQKFRNKMRARGIKPEIPKRKWKKKPKRGRPAQLTSPRYIVERAHSWLQRKYRRITTRWERLPSCFECFLKIGFVHFWLKKLVA